jgi:integrase
MGTSNANGFRGTGKKNVTTNSKEDALNGIEFERYFAATHDLEPYYRDRAQFAVLALGQLGLRRGELTHLTSDWVEWRDEMVKIPRERPCTDGKGGDVCGECKRLARQKARQKDDRTVKEMIEQYWIAKSDAAARRVHFGFDPRIRLVFERFFDRFEDGWVWSGMTATRDVEKVAEIAGMSTDRLRPHSLRATAATHHAARGMDIYGLMQYFGWIRFSTAEKYINRNVMATIRNMNSWNGPAVP